MPVCVFEFVLYVNVSTTAANNITFPPAHVSACCCLRADRQSDRIHHHVIIPIMHTDSEQGNDVVKRSAHGSKQPVINSVSVFFLSSLLLVHLHVSSVSCVCTVCAPLTCCVMAKPITGSPSGMSHVTTAEVAFTALMVTLTGGDKLSANTQRERERNRSLFYLLQYEMKNCRNGRQYSRKPNSVVWINGSAESIM